MVELVRSTPCIPGTAVRDSSSTSKQYDMTRVVLLLLFTGYAVSIIRVPCCYVYKQVVRTRCSYQEIGNRHVGWYGPAFRSPKSLVTSFVIRDVDNLPCHMHAW